MEFIRPSRPTRVALFNCKIVGKIKLTKKNVRNDKNVTRIKNDFWLSCRSECLIHNGSLLALVELVGLVGLV